MPCTTSPALPADAVSDTQTFYDGATTLGAAPHRRERHRDREGHRLHGSTPVYTTSPTATYDEYGRMLTTTNADGDNTTTAYTPATGAEPTSIRSPTRWAWSPPPPTTRPATCR